MKKSFLLQTALCFCLIFFLWIQPVSAGTPQDIVGDFYIDGSTTPVSSAVTMENTDTLVVKFKELSADSKFGIFASTYSKESITDVAIQGWGPLHPRRAPDDDGYLTLGDPVPLYLFGGIMGDAPAYLSPGTYYFAIATSGGTIYCSQNFTVTDGNPTSTEVTWAEGSQLTASSLAANATDVTYTLTLKPSQNMTLSIGTHITLRIPGIRLNDAAVTLKNKEDEGIDIWAFGDNYCTFVPGRWDVNGDFWDEDKEITAEEGLTITLDGVTNGDNGESPTVSIDEINTSAFPVVPINSVPSLYHIAQTNLNTLHFGMEQGIQNGSAMNFSRNSQGAILFSVAAPIYLYTNLTPTNTLTATAELHYTNTSAAKQIKSYPLTFSEENLFRNDGELPADIAAVDKVILKLNDDESLIDEKEISLGAEVIANDLALSFSGITPGKDSEKRVVIYDEDDNVVYSHSLSDAEITDVLSVNTLADGTYSVALRASLGSHYNYSLGEKEVTFDGTDRVITETLNATGDLTTITPIISGVKHSIIKWFSDENGENLIYTGYNYVLLPDADVYFQVIPTEEDEAFYMPSSITKATADTAAPTVEVSRKPLYTVTGTLVRDAWYQGETGTTPVSFQLITATIGTEHPVNYSIYTNGDGSFSFDGNKQLPYGAELSIAGIAYNTKTVTVNGENLGTITMEQAGGLVKFSAYRQRVSAEGPSPVSYFAPVTTATLTCGAVEIPGYVKDGYFHITDATNIPGGIGATGTLTLYGDNCSGTGTVTLNKNHSGEARDGENPAITMTEYGYVIFDIQNTNNNACYCLIYDSDGNLCYTDTGDSIYNTGRKFTYPGPQLPAGAYTYAFIDAEQYELLGAENFDTLTNLRATPQSYYSTATMTMRNGYVEKGTASLPSAAVTESRVNQDASGISVELYEDYVTNRIVIAEGNLGIDDNSMSLVVYSNQSGNLHGIPYINGITAATDVTAKKENGFYRIDIPDVTKYGGYPLTVQFTHERSDRTAINSFAYAAFGSTAATGVKDLSLFHVADYSEISPAISLVVPEYSNKTEVNVYGYAPAYQEVEILADGEVVAKVKADNASGLYNATCTLPNPSDYKSYTFTANTKVDGETVTADEAVMIYSTDTPILKTIELTDYRGNKKLVYEEGKAYELGYYYLPSVDTGYIATFDNIIGDAAVSEVTLYVETGNDITEIPMTKQGDVTYIASYPFGDSIPGNVWVGYEVETATPEVKIAETTPPSDWDEYYSWGSDLELGLKAATETGYFKGEQDNFTEIDNGLTATFDLNYGTVGAPIWLTLKIEQQTEVLSADAFTTAVNSLPQQPTYDQEAEDQGYIDIEGFASVKYARLWENNGIFTNRAIYSFNYDNNSGDRLIFDNTVTMKEFKTVCYDEKNSAVTTFTRTLLDEDLAANPTDSEASDEAMRISDNAMELVYQWFGVNFVIEEINNAVAESANAVSPSPSILKSGFQAFTVTPSNGNGGPKKYQSIGDADTIRQILNDNANSDFSAYCATYQNDSGTALGGLDKQLAKKWGWSAVTDLGKMMLDAGKGAATGGMFGTVKSMTQWWVKTFYSESEYAKERKAADKELSKDLKRLRKALQDYEKKTGHKANWSHMPKKFQRPKVTAEPLLIYGPKGGTPGLHNLKATKKIPKTKPRVDPSGFVYEAVASNRLNEVTSTIYQNDGSNGLMLWDAAAAEQVNPYITNEKGEYEWFVDPGKYTIQYGKTGYETYWTQLTDGLNTTAGGDYNWLPVPPVQLDVNIGLVSYAAPTVEEVSAQKDDQTGDVAIYVTFDRYLNTDLTTNLSNQHCTVYGPQGALEVEFVGNLDQEPGVADPSQSYARTFRLTGDALNTLEVDDTFDLRIVPTSQSGAIITSYAGIPMAATAEIKDIAVTDKEEVATPVITLAPGEYEVNQPITLTCPTPNTTIYYTTNGEEPDVYALKYTEPILLTKSMTIKARAITKTDGFSEIATAAFTLKDKEENIPNIEPVPITAVKLSKASLTLLTGATETLTASITPNDAEDKTVTWKSSNNTVASVDDNGKITAKAPGTAVITVTTNDCNKSDTCTVTVKPSYVDVTGVTLNKSTLTLTAGKSETLVATVAPTNATDKKVSWKSSNSTLASVDNNGKITAKAATTAVTGKVTITATAGGKSASCTVTVVWQANPFTDVSSSAYYYNAVMWAVFNGVTSGTSNTTFSPDDPCTRGHVVTFLWRAMGRPEPTSAVSPFTDVQNSGEYYYKAVLWAVEKGITNGTSATTFSPNATVTRGQVVTFIWRANGSPKVSATNPFTDVSSSAYYYDAVLWAVANNITAGTSKTTFGPEERCIRSQVVTFLYRDAMNK